MNRNYVLILDKSMSMARSDPSLKGKTRWQAAHEATWSLASHCAQHDPNGIDVYVFSDNFNHYPETTPDKVDDIFTKERPGGTTDLTKVLKAAIDNHFKQDGFPTTILVVTDGEPNDYESVMRTIVQASNKIKSDDDLAISIIQVGEDAQAKKFLGSLDNDLQKFGGAKFDIVDTITFEIINQIGLDQALLRAVQD